MTSLPKLYRDAVTITRELGVRYLWIDSLCIIQGQSTGPQSDWTQEAAKMGSVYRNSYCNIAAMDASDSTGTCFYEHKKTSTGVGTVHVGWKGEDFFLIDERNREYPANRPLSKRAWVLQEELLAPRALLFTNDQVYWECCTYKASEIFVRGYPDQRESEDLLRGSDVKEDVHSLKRRIHKTPSFSSESSHINPSISFWRSWKTIVEDYTRRYLTFPMDKTAAIAGIVSQLEVDHCEHPNLLKNRTYKAGLWYGINTIEQELCWKAENNTPIRPHQYRAPTWSWLSVEGAITYRRIDDLAILDLKQQSCVQSIKVVTSDRTSTGQIQSGWIQIKGRLLENSSYSYVPDNETQPPPTHVSLLAMFSVYLSFYVWGLALRRTGSRSGRKCYERVGYFSIVNDFWIYEDFISAPIKVVRVI